MTNPVSSACTGVTAKSVALLHEDQVKIRYKIKLDAGKKISDYVVQIDNVTVDAKDIVATGDNTYYIYSRGLNPQDYDVKFALTISDGTNTLKVTYCALDYIARMCAKEDTSDELKDLLKAMYNYHLAAESYLESKNNT